MGNADRIFRITAAIVFGILYFTGTITGALGIILLIFGAVFLLTSFVGFCPLYALLGMNTCSNTNR